MILEEVKEVTPFEEDQLELVPAGEGKKDNKKKEEKTIIHSTDGSDDEENEVVRNSS